MRKRFWIELSVVLALTILALAVRLYRLPDMPPGLYTDEANNGTHVLGIFNGQRPIFFRTPGQSYGLEPLFIYLQALSVAVLGTTPFALRVTSAVIGAATVPALYWMVREAFTRRPDVRWLALWSALCLALSYWHLVFSRIGFRAIMLPLLACITFAWFWRAWWRLESGGRFPWMHVVLTGACLGITLYTYLSARFVPVLLLLVGSVGVLQARRSPVLWQRRMLAVAAMLAIALVVFLPLGLYFLKHPDVFAQRAVETLVLSPQRGGAGGPLIALAKNVLKTAGMFGVAGDTNLRHNPALRPAFDPLLTAWLMLGVILAITRRQCLAYSFALIWLGVLALPALLTDGAPHYLRMLGVLPAVCLLPVLAMLEAGKYVTRRLAGLAPHPRAVSDGLPGGRPVGETSADKRRLAGLVSNWQKLAIWLPLPFLLFSGLTGLRDYFSASQRDAVRYAYDTRFVDAASLMSGHMGPEEVWIIPAWPVYYLPEPGYIFDFLLRGQVPLGVVNAGERAAPGALRDLTSGRDRAYLLEWLNAALEPDGGYVLRDAKHLVRFLLDKYGRAVSESGKDLISYTTYELPVSSDYRVTTDTILADIAFGDKIKLTGFSYGHTAVSRDEPPAALDEKRLPSGHDAWAVLRWQALENLGNNLKASLYLTDANGHVAGQVDDLLVSDDYLLYDTWAKGKKASTYHILPTLPAIPPGRYQLRVAVYDPETMVRLPVVASGGEPGATSAYLGDLEVTRPILPPLISPANSLPAGTNLGSDLRLLGYDLPARTASPGDRLALTLYWRANSKPAGDYLIGLELRDAQAQAVLRQEARPANGAHPTATWSAGEVMRDWRDLVLPREMPAGSYELVVTLNEGVERLGQASLGAVQVSGRPHEFAPPVVEHEEAARLGDSFGFLGYDLGATQVEAGSPISLTLHWQSLGPADTSYTVFVHLLGSDGQAWAQQDNAPGQGTLPTTGWVLGEYITDPFRLVVKPEVPVGEYHLEIGMYDPATGVRLPIADAAGQAAGDRILLNQPVHITGQ